MYPLNISIISESEKIVYISDSVGTNVCVSALEEALQSRVVKRDVFSLDTTCLENGGLDDNVDTELKQGTFNTVIFHVGADTN